MPTARCRAVDPSWVACIHIMVGVRAALLGISSAELHHGGGEGRTTHCNRNTYGAELHHVGSRSRVRQRFEAAQGGGCSRDSLWGCGSLGEGRRKGLWPAHCTVLLQHARLVALAHLGGKRGMGQDRVRAHGGAPR